MKLAKGLFSDCALQDTPLGCYPFAKNIVASGNLQGAKENEDGFLNAGALAPYTIIGMENVGKDIVVFSTDNVNSEIGLVIRNGEVLTYSIVYNDPALAFSTSHPIIDIEYRIDVNNQRTVAWNDQFNTPRLINIDNPPATGNLQELNLFRDINNPALLTYAVKDTGGSLKTGAYIIITKYRNTLDLAETNWFIHDHVFYINDDPILSSFQNNDGAVGGTSTSKSISLSFTGSDTRYDTLIVGYVYSSNGVLTAAQALTISNSSTVNTTLTGGEANIPVSTDSVVTSTTSYATAGSLTQLAGRLFLANLSADPMPALQQAALGIQVTWSATLLNAVTNVGSYKDVTPPSFMPGEVYALYLGVELNKGGWRCYHIPGRAPLTGEKDAVSNYGLSYTRFQVEDTIPSLTTQMGYWENSNENYPNTSDFNNGTGIDLRGLNVRHHRMPSLTYLSQNTFSGDSTFGITTLPRLTLNVSNVVIPAGIQSQIKRWKIFYAKKSVDNSLTTGSDLLHYAFKTSAQPGTSWNTGGNWYIGTTHSGWQSFDTPDTTKIRCHSLDYLNNRSLPAPNYVSYAYKLRSASLKYAAPGDQYNGFGTVGNITVTGNQRGGTASAVIDFTVTGTTRTSGSTAIAGLSNFAYLPQNSLNGADSNAYNESNYVATLAPGFSPTSAITFTQVATRGTGETSQDNQFDRFGFNQVDTMVGMYYLLLSSVHNSFSNQTVVPLEGYQIPSSTSGSFTGGDGFISYMSYMTAAPMCANPIGNIGRPTLEGLRMWNAYIGYSRNNWNFRYQTQGNIDTYYYPKTDPRTMVNVSMLTLVNPSDPFNNGVGSSEISLLDLASNFPNSINYNVDYSTHNELNTPIIFDPRVTNQTKFPNTIIFTPVGSEESQVTSWKTFLSGDRYVMPKNKGYITNLQGINNKQLLIHTQYTLFRTRTDMQMATAANTENIYIQSASIFGISPEEVLPNKSGYAGTQHKQACRLTKAGYFFVDDIQGKAFLYTGSLEEISYNGQRNFFKNFKLAQANQGTEAWVSNGYTSGFDERNNRLIVSKKEGATSWTLSYDPTEKQWICYHDYIPDHMFTTVDSVLYGVNGNKVYIHNLLTNNAAKGVFYSNTPASSFIDVPCNPDASDKLFTGARWITELYPNTQVNGQYNQTLNYPTSFTHLTFRTLDHTTGRIQLNYNNSFYSQRASNVRSINRTWYFNDIRDIAKSTGFTLGLYSNFNIDPTKLNTYSPWYNKRRFIDKFVICRFEYDNTANNRCIFIEGEVEFEPVAK